MQLTPYLMFSGNCEEALNFYAKALSGEIKNMMRFEGTPGESMSADKDKIMHSNFESKYGSFMASDGDQEEKQSGKVHLSINFDAVADEEKVFKALGEGGKVTMPLQDTFWGAKFGMLTDRYGINWMFNCDAK